MNLKIAQPKNIRELSIYLEKMNTHNASHIGFCGERNEEIYDSLMTDFSDLTIKDSFLVAYNEEEIIGAIGLDIDLEDEYADVWGPFSTNNNIDVAQKLWDEILLNAPADIKANDFFINKQNIFAKEFLEKNNAKHSGTDFILSITREEYLGENTGEAIKFEDAFQKSFEKLHSFAFPKTYYTPTEILSRIDDHNVLFLIKDGETKIKGYVYIETKPEHNEANIEYIAVYPEYRGEGIGKKLINDAMNYIFSFPTIKEVDICVASNNDTAINLYKSSGFKEKYILDSYEI